MKTLVLTGGSSGIGRATCVLFAERGWQVFELSRHGKTEAHITHIYCDVCHEESVRDAIAQVLAQTDHIDVVISNAGFGISGAVEFTTIDEAKKQFDVIFSVQCVWCRRSCLSCANSIADESSSRVAWLRH